MNIFTLSMAILISLFFVSGVASAAEPTVVINGGGIARSNNEPLQMLAVGGFSAMEKKGIAKGQVQIKVVLAADPTISVASIHGKVVCVKDHGGTWEVRFELSKATGAVAGLLGLHGGIFLSDGGSPGANNDMVGEDLNPPFTAQCRDSVPVNLEPLFAGNFTVHQ